MLGHVENLSAENNTPTSVQHPALHSDLGQAQALDVSEADPHDDDGRNQPSTAMIGPLASQTKASLYCCTLCSSKRSYLRRSDWSKHEKEHEFKYVCLRKDFGRRSEGGRSCDLCEIKQPCEHHASLQILETCHFVCKRRDQMVKHLSNSHAFYDDAGALLLAKQWLQGSGRRFWSCGFCVILFWTFQERLKHIADEHLEKGKSVRDWDMTNVIKGLLSQPHVYDSFELEVEARPGLSRSELSWQASNLEDLQLQLEFGPTAERDASFLAKAAFDACRVQEWPFCKDTQSNAMVQTQGVALSSSKTPMTGILPVPNPVSQEPMSSFVPSRTQDDLCNWLPAQMESQTVAPTSSDPISSNCHSSQDSSFLPGFLAQIPSAGSRAHSMTYIEQCFQDDLANLIDPVLFSDSADEGINELGR